MVQYFASPFHRSSGFKFQLNFVYIPPFSHKTLDCGRNRLMFEEPKSERTASRILDLNIGSGIHRPRPFFLRSHVRISSILILLPFPSASCQRFRVSPSTLHQSCRLRSLRKSLQVRATHEPHNCGSVPASNEFQLPREYSMAAHHHELVASASNSRIAGV